MLYKLFQLNRCSSLVLPTLLLLRQAETAHAQVELKISGEKLRPTKDTRGKIPLYPFVHLFVDAQLGLLV